MLLPLTFACVEYLSNDSRDMYIGIFEEVINSFEKLNKVYETNEITQTIEQLKNIILRFIPDKNFNPISIVSNWNESASMLKKSFYSQTNSVWTSNRLKILLGYIEEIANANTDENKLILIISLNTFMNFIDLLVCNLLNNLHLLR